MVDKIKEIMAKAKDGWQQMSKRKRYIMIALLAGIILFTSLYTYFSKRSNYVVLFNNLELDDAGYIVDDLEAKKINYRLEDKGTKILIDEKYVDEYRLELAMEGNMPESSSGFEIFDDIGMMATDDDRKIMYQRALEGELQRSIMSLDAVNSAKVHLVMAEKSIFEDEEKEASASIILDLDPGKTMSGDTVRGISSLVSGAVENLPRENIEIIDSKGNLISSGGEEAGELDSVSLVDKHQAIKDRFERKMESNLMNLLGDVFGRDSIKVAINVDLDFDAEETTTIEYEDPVIRSQEIEISGEDIDIRQDEGGNIGDNFSNVIEGIAGDGSFYKSITNNELSEEKTTTVKAPGKINKMTTSVVYDGILTPDQIDQIENIVATATGYDIDRDDLINVVGIEFDDGQGAGFPDTDLPEGTIVGDFLREHWKIGLGILLGLIVLIITIAVVRRLREEDLEEEDMEEIYRDFLDMQERSVSERDPGEDTLEVTIGEDENKAKNYAKENPDLVADLIRAWLKDSR